MLNCPIVVQWPVPEPATPERPARTVAPRRARAEAGPGQRWSERAAVPNLALPDNLSIYGFDDNPLNGWLSG